MNSRERVSLAIRHLPPDRVPIDLGGTRQSGIAYLAAIRLDPGNLRAQNNLARVRARP